MRAEHTPGPWTVTGFDSESGTPAQISGTGPICSLFRHNPDNEANARLIAAAPEMLAALHGVDVLYAELSRAIPGIANTPAYDIVQAAVAAARAAIAKAEGRAS